MAEKNLPIGIQDFPKLIENGCVYVDKTAYCHRLITQGKYYFLIRPRRFGKSLLISTLKAIFEGQRELFQGLWIEDQHDWEPRPVILLDFSMITNIKTHLEDGIKRELGVIAQRHGVRFSEGTHVEQFAELIQSLARLGKVAILVDSYDKPLVDKIDNPAIVHCNQEVLRDMYAVIKDKQCDIDFLMIAGIANFKRGPIFSDFNDLDDITLDPAYAQMFGFTCDEIVRYFPSYLENMQSNWADNFSDLFAEMKAWYNGYTWDGMQQVCNPISILEFFSKNCFGDYWYKTGSSTFLPRLIREAGFGIFDLEKAIFPTASLNHIYILDIEIKSLLFQTGYLTIKKFNYRGQSVVLDLPNREVAIAFSFHLLSEFAEKSKEGTDSLIRAMAAQLRAGEVPAFMDGLKALFAGIAYPIQPGIDGGIENYEKYYHTMFYLVLRLLGYDIQAEVLTHTGRIDAVVTANGHVYVIEFKLGDAADAMAQIHRKGYHQAYLSSGKKVVLLGIGFDVATRNVGGYLVEELG